MGVVSLRSASQLARTATKKNPVWRRVVKNSLSPNITACWSDWGAPRLSSSIQGADPEHHSRVYLRLADFAVSTQRCQRSMWPPGPRPPSGQLGAASLVFGVASQNRLARYLCPSPMLSAETQEHVVFVQGGPTAFVELKQRSLIRRLYSRSILFDPAVCCC